MKISVFKYLDYRRFILDLLAEKPFAGRGERKRLSAALGCQMAFITHVLSGEKDFNHEQVLKIAHYLNLSEVETDYFLELVSYNRAGTKDLEVYYKQKLAQKQEHHKMLKNRLQGTQTLSAQDQAQYYSHWLYGAVHMASTVPALQTVKALSDHFRIASTELVPILEFLASKDFLVFQSGSIKPGSSHLFVGKDSPLEYHHHAVWRVKALHDLNARDSDDFRYTLCFSASDEDWPLLREKLVTTINECLAVIRPSKEERLGLICMDFQKV